MTPLWADEFEGVDGSFNGAGLACVLAACVLFIVCVIVYDLFDR